ncbi:MAG TPA: DUF4386 domain-containing protein [Gemmatimonadales bacterium]|nr:DUF4386 domain-containing protein [Gemmatimonadales bacterium]
MTRTTNARIAGFTFLFYIAVAFPSLVLMNRATAGDGLAAQLAHVAEHASDVRLAILLTLLSCFSAVVLAVTLYGITRDEDHELATLVMAARLAEGVLGAIGIPSTLGLLWLATAASGAGTAGAPDLATTNTLAALYLMPPQGAMIGAPFFALGSLTFSYLLLRGRMVPAPLAWIGVLASALVVVCAPLQLAGFLSGPITTYMWLPMLVFEVPLGLWLLIKGVAAPATIPRRGASTG